MKTIQVRNDFSAGEVNVEALERKDSRAAQNGLRKARNIRQRNGGGFSRRAGSDLLTALTVGKRGVGYTYDSTYSYCLIFSSGRMDAYDATTGAAAGSVTGCAWNDVQAVEMSVTPIDERIVISHQSLGLYTVTRTGPSTWAAIANFTYDSGSGSSKLQPYYRYAAKGITMQPSALTGSINLTASSAVFLDPQHVGVRFRYLGREVEVTSVTSATVAVCTVIQTLPKTVTLTVGSSTGFKIGDRVEGDVTAAAGYVTSVPGGTSVNVLIETGQTGFSTSENLVGPDARTTISATSNTTPAATTIWDEQAFSAARGYPGEVSTHRKRLILTDWRDAQDAWVAGSTRSVADFDVGEALDDDAISELLTSSPRERIRHAVSSETLLLLTDRNVYYVPEGRENVLAPTYASLFKATPVGCSAVNPIQVEQGVLFVEKGENRILLLAPTGQITSPWSVTDLSRLVPHFVVTPVELTATLGDGAAPERYAYSVNTDGTVASLFYRDDDPIYGWVLHTTQGLVKSMWVADGKTFQLVERTINGVSKLFMERLRNDALLDCTISFSDPGGGSALLPFVGQSVYVVEGSACHGAFTIGPGGVISGLESAGTSFEAGFSFAVEAESVSPVILQNINASGPLLRIPRAWVTVYESSVYAVNGQLMPAYRGDEDDSALPRLRSETRMWRFFGRSPAPTVSITQDLDQPSPLTVLSMTMEVSG